MKKLIQVLKSKGAVAVLPLLAGASAFAQSGQLGNINGRANVVNTANLNVGNVNQLLGVGGTVDSVITFLTIIVLVVAGVFFVLAGFGYMTSGGDPEKVTAAKHKLVYAAIGLAIALLARVLYSLVVNIVGRL